MGGKESNGIVSPVVPQSPFDEVAILDESVDRQKLHRRHPQFTQMPDHHRMRQPIKGAAHGFRHLWMKHGETAHVHFIYGGLVRLRFLLAVAPGERRIDDAAFGHEGGAVPGVERQIPFPVAHHIAEQGIVPNQVTVQCLGIGIEQQLVVVEAMPFLGLIRAVNAIAVESSRTNIGQIAVPDLIGVFGQFDTGGFLAAVGAEQAQLDPLRVGGKQGKIGARTIKGGAQRMWGTGPDTRM